MNTLRIEHISHSYTKGQPALDGISLELGNGLFGLLGPNGAGKSTLMRIIAGLQKPQSGRLLFNGVDTLNDPQFLKKQLGYLPQDFGVYPRLSAYELLDHLAVLKGLGSAPQRREQIMALLDKTNLYGHRCKAVSGFSGGMRQRFGIAQALLGNPQILIVDEPTAGLDPEERNRFNNLLSEISEQIVVILSTHLVEDVSNLCSRMAIIDAGRLIACGKPETFIQELEGSVWTRRIDAAERKAYEQLYRVVSHHFNAGKLHLTIQAEGDPGNGFVPKQPGLDDVYFVQLSKTRPHV